MKSIRCQEFSLTLTKAVDLVSQISLSVGTVHRLMTIILVHLALENETIMGLSGCHFRAIRRVRQIDDISEMALL